MTDTRAPAGYGLSFLVCVAIATAMACVFWLVVNAMAHSFYSRVCCDSSDCAPALKVEHDGSGEWITTKHGRAWAPYSPSPAFTADRILPSPDGQTHACILNGKLICVYRAPGT